MADEEDRSVHGSEGVVQQAGQIMMLRWKYLHLSDTSGMAILWDVNGEAAFSVWRSRQLDIRRWASSIWASVIRDPITVNR